MERIKNDKLRLISVLFLMMSRVDPDKWVKDEYKKGKVVSSSQPPWISDGIILFQAQDEFKYVNLIKYVSPEAGTEKGFHFSFRSKF